MKEPPEYPARRIVKPRHPGPAHYPVIAVDKHVLLERTGETFSLEELPAVIVAERSSILVAQGMGAVLHLLHERFRDNEQFQYRLSPSLRENHNLNGKRKRRVAIQDATCSLLGFKGHYHHPLDPVSFCRLGIDDIDDSHRPRIIKLLEWARGVREFCLANELPIKASSGGLAAQLLRDGRFYPRARRKVPKLVNAKARPHLTGNYYRLYIPERSFRRECLYLDMRNAHHEIAKSLPFPCANSLHAYGRFGHEDGIPWVWPDSPRFDAVLSKPGLFLAYLRSPLPVPGSFPPPHMEKRGTRLVWIYSNELPMIRRLGGEIEGIVAAIISDESETGINRFASWAIEELDKRKAERGWLKPTLHSVYGVLGVRPQTLEFGWRICQGGTAEVYPMGQALLPVQVIRSRRRFEPNIANVIHRGMIEAETRVQSLALARKLHSQGVEVLCIYADSLFVSTPQPPLLPRPWTVKAALTGIRFLSATQFTSTQLTRLPGLSRNLRPSPATVPRLRRVR